jgi:hypothetical protein
VASFVLPFDCPACRVTTIADVGGLDDPEQFIDARTRAVLGAKVADLEVDLLRQGARRTLLHATCPACGKRNPEGIAAQKRERRWSVAVGFVLYGALVVAAYFAPRIALVVPILGASIQIAGAVALHRRGQARWGRFALHLVVNAALAALVILVPRAAPLVPLIGLLESLRPIPPDERPWTEAAAAIQFETEA